MATSDRRLLRAVANYSRFNARRTLGAETESAFSCTDFGRALALADPARPRLPMYNRVLGLGVGDAGRVGDILAHYKALGCEPHFDLGPEAIVEPDLIGGLVERGFEPMEAIEYRSRAPSATAASAANPRREFVVERWGHERADAFRDLLGRSGVECPDAVWARRRELYATDEFRVFVARVGAGGEPVAWATSFIDGDNRLAYLANAFTLPERRNGGCHRGLLDARLADAKASGLKTALTDVVPDTAGARNCERAGFGRRFTLTLWRR